MFSEFCRDVFESSRLVNFCKRLISIISNRLKKVQVVVEFERGPVTTETGFTEAALKTTVINKGKVDVYIEDIRAMFCLKFGLPVLPEAPLLRKHDKLPSTLKSRSKGIWYFPAEKLSTVLRDLHRPSMRSGVVVKSTRVHVRCETSSGKVYVSLPTEFSMDPNSHFP